MAPGCATRAGPRGPSSVKPAIFPCSMSRTSCSIAFSPPRLVEPPATLWRNPRDHLVGLHDVAPLAVHAVRVVDLQPRRTVGVARDFVEIRRTEARARMAVLGAADRAADIRVHQQVRGLILVVRS